MTFLTGLALRRSSVTFLVIVLLVASGVFSYQRLERELFPDLEFPNITVIASYPSADPETVAREVAEPIENAIANIDGLRETQSVSQENFASVLATFEFGEDMKDAQQTIESQINGADLPDDVTTTVSRINNNTFPVMQLSVVGDRDIPSLQHYIDDLVVPRFERVDGVSRVYVLGQVEERVTVSVDPERLQELGLSMSQVSEAVRSNNMGLPAGNIADGAITFPVRAINELSTLDDILNLTVGYEAVVLPGGAPGGRAAASLDGQRPILLSDVARVELGTADAASISRTNGKPSLNITIIKDPDANTVDVTEGIQQVVSGLDDLPPDIEILELSNNGPIVERSLSSLLREGLLGFLFAVSAVFIFLINTRPTLLRGIALTLRPTIIIGISIPLSVLTGIVLMSFTSVSLNVMSLAGLAIAVGRVVDDSIVVLENTYRHIQRGEERMQAAIIGAREVGAAIVASTLTTVVVFLPLAFIQGLVGEFFTPFALSVSFALIASTLVALTAVPVLGVALLRRGDFPEAEGDDQDLERETWLQKVYTPILTWSLGHKLIALLSALAITGASLSLLLVIPVTLFPAGTPEYLLVDVELPQGTAVSQTFSHVERVENVLQELVDQGQLSLYQVTIGQGASEFDTSFGAGNLHLAGFIMRTPADAPENIADLVRERLPQSDDQVTISLQELENGPPAGDLEVVVTGPSYTDLTATALELEAKFREIDGIINLRNDVSDARDEVNIRIDPAAAARFGLTTQTVVTQVNQYILGRAATEIELDNLTLDVVVRGNPEDVDDIEKLKNLPIQGPLGLVRLGVISEIAIEQGPVRVSTFDGNRSATITGNIVAVDTQAVGQEVQAAIDELTLPPGISVRSGGIFQQIAEGFQDIFLAMAVGIILVYLVMVASLGSLRDPLIIVLSLPLAVVGGLSALFITDRTLSLSALMGFLLLIGIVVTNAIVLITFVTQLRERGLGVYEALVRGGRVRLRPILMTAFTTTLALFPLALAGGDDSGVVGAELATVVIGGLISSTFLTLVVVPIIYTLFHWSIPRLPGALRHRFRRAPGQEQSVPGAPQLP